MNGKYVYQEGAAQCAGSNNHLTVKHQFQSFVSDVCALCNQLQSLAQGTPYTFIVTQDSLLMGDCVRAFGDKIRINLI